MRIASVRLPGQTGLSLVELMISLAISSVILLVTVNFYAAISRSSGLTLQASKLNQELQALVAVMASEIRRAGFTADTSVVTDPIVNTFNDVDKTALNILASRAAPTTSAASGECILFAYDRDEDMALDHNEPLGFRLNNGVVQMRTRVEGDLTEARNDDCDDADETWLDLTDGRLLTITSLAFDSSGSTCINLREPDGVNNDSIGGVDDAIEADCYDASNIPSAGSGDKTVETRQIEISVTGQLNNDAITTASTSQVVLVRNDLVRVR
jgi:prepilin peptidase dependent protein B